MNKNILYSLGLIILLIGLGTFLLRNTTEKETQKNSDKSEKEISTNQKKQDQNEIINSDYKIIDYTAPDSNGNDYAINSNHRKVDIVTKEQNKLLEETRRLANEAAPIKRIIINNLRNRNINNLIFLTHPDVIKENGLDVIRDAYIDYSEYFKDFKFLNEDNGTISRLLDDSGSVIGIIFEEHFDTISGGKKVFTITMIPNKAKYYVAEFTPGQTIKNIDERNGS